MTASGAGTTGPLLAARELAVGYAGGAKPLASGIGLKLEAGQFAALVGPNGSGKSTLLRSLVGLQPPLGGTAELCGTEIGRLSADERSRRVASVFTDRYDPGYFSVHDIVAFGRYPYTDARNRLGECDRVAVDSAIAAVGLESLARRRFSELSDGERQKALIARAIAQDCPVLVLDEPTAFLDAPARVEVFHLARDLARASAKAVVLSTHDIDHALRYADLLWLMDAEHRFQAGAPEDLAISGAIGRAFDGESFRFDRGTGAFRSAEEGRPFAIALSGPDGVSRAWAERLAGRLGLVVAKGGSGAPQLLASICIEEAEGGPRFAILAAGASHAESASSYGELARLLSRLVAERGALPGGGGLAP